MQGWPPGDHDLSTRLLRECCDHGGWCYGLFDGARLIGVAALERRFIGQPADMLQLVFLHVSRDYRDQGLGRQLFMRAGGGCTCRRRAADVHLGYALGAHDPLLSWIGLYPLAGT
jgi:GNAT superfamily N-acetyltransferase